MNKLVSTRIFQTNAKICGRCGMDNTHKSNGCCHDEVKFVKLVQDQNTITIDSYGIPAIEQLYIIPSPFIATSFYNINEQLHFHNHSPPLLSAQDIYLQNNVFRI